MTFIMVFAIQHTSNREAKAILLKLDVLIKATNEADNNLIAAEELNEKELNELKASLKDATK